MWTLVNYQKLYEYKPETQKLDIPYNGYYKVELWGASGGGTVDEGTFHENEFGLGGYVSGEINITKNTLLYVYIGQKGIDATLTEDAVASFNGGGGGTWDHSDNESSGGGGGATDIRTVNGGWNDNNSLRSRIIVAGAGGGQTTGYYWGIGNKAGAGGGLTGISNHSINTAGHQTGGYQFGIGQTGVGYQSTADCGVSGGGGGWYGGTSVPCAGTSGNCSAAGGSSYISGHTGSVAVSSTTNSSPKSGCETGTSNNACSITPYINPATGKGYTFTNTAMIDGAGYKWTDVKGSQQQMPNPSSGNYALGVGHTGNGYARITWLGDTLSVISVPFDGR